MSDSLIDSIDGITWIDDETALNAKNMNNIEKRISINDTNIREVNSDLNSFKNSTNMKLTPLEDIDSNRISSWDNKFGPTDSYKTPSEMLDQLQPKADVSQTDPTKRDFIKNKNLLVSDVREKDSSKLSFIKNKEDLIADFDAEEQNLDGTPNLSYIKNKQVMEVGRLVSTISNALDDDPTFIQITNEEKVVYSAEYPELYSLLPNHKKFFELEGSFTKYNVASSDAVVYNGDLYFVSDTSSSVSKLNMNTNTLSSITFAIPEQYDEYKFKCVEDVWFLEARRTVPAEEGSELPDTSNRHIYYSTELPTEASYWTLCTFDGSVIFDIDNTTPVYIDFYSSGVMKQNYYGWYIRNGYNVYFTEDINSGSFTNLKYHLNLSTTIFGSGSKTIKDFVPFDKTTSNTAVGVINVNGTLYMLYNNGVFSAQSLGVSSSSKLVYIPDNTILNIRYISSSNYGIFKITTETTSSGGIIDTGIHACNLSCIGYKHNLDTTYSILYIDTNYTPRYGDTPLYTNIGSNGSFLVIDNDLYIHGGSSLLLKYSVEASPLADGAATIKLNTGSPAWTPMLGYEKVYVKAKSKYSN